MRDSLEWLILTPQLEEDILEGDILMGYSKEWIDDDWNPKGIRECFINDGGELGWTSMKWCGTCDDYHCDNESKPTHIFILPDISNL